MTSENQSSSTMFVVDSHTAQSPTEPQMDIVRMVCAVWLSMPIAIAGIVGNILSLIVLLHYKQTLTTTVVLEALAVADTLVLLSTLFLQSFRYIIPYYDHFMRHIFPWAFGTTHLVRLVDTWLTVLLTVDRYIAVCHPLHAQRLCTVRRTCVIIVVIVVAVSAFCIPRYFEYKTVDFSISSTGFTQTDLIYDQKYAVAYSILAFFVVMYLIPMSVLVILNGRILLAVRKSNNLRQSTLGIHHGPSGISARSVGNGRSSASATRTVTMIAATIVTICIICNVTAMVAHVFYSLSTAFKETFGHLEYYRRHLANYSNVLINLNSAINFVVYCTFSRKFRSVFVRVFRLRHPLCCSRKNMKSKETSDSSSSSTRRSYLTSRCSQSTMKPISMTSIGSSVRHGVVSNGEKECRLLCDDDSAF